MSKRSAAAWSAARSVGSFVQFVTRQLETARDLQQVAVAVKSILVAFIQPHSHQAWCAVADGELQDISRNLEQHADAVGWCALQQSFFQDQFPSWATCVLTVAGGEWLPQDQDGTLQQLIQDTFLQCPATQALEALTGHLSAVLPTLPNRHSSTVTAVAADLAAELLAQRFAAAGSTGVQQLLRDVDAAWQQQQQQVAAQPPEQQQNAHASTPFPSQEQQQQEESEPSNQQQAAAPAAGDVCSHLCDEQRQEEIAAVLASVPDRVQQLPDVALLLQSDQFICHVLQQAVTYVAQHVIRNHSSSSSKSATSGPIAFTALLLRKFITRGHARSTAVAILHLLPPAELGMNGNFDAGDTAADGDCVRSSKQQQQQQQQIVALQAVLLQLSDHKSAAEKLLVQLLRLATAQQHAAAHPQQQQQQQRFMSLLCPLLSCSSNLRGIVTRRLLIGRTLPAASLSLLLLLLQRCQPTLLPEAAVVLAQSWSEQTNILQLPVQQQAYMTAALVDCMQQLPKDLLDPLTTPVPQSSTAAAANASQNADTGSNPHIAAALFSITDKGSVSEGIEPQRLSLLLPAILQGVSSRLASPSAAIRSQAMRVGRAFSVKLDPDKPLFTDAGDLLLMPEEIWPGALPRKQIKDHDHDHDQQRQRQQQQQQSPVVQDSSDAGVVNAAASSSSTSSSKFAALNRLQEALASPEPDSDDDEEFVIKAAAAAAGGGPKGSNTSQHHAPSTNHNVATNTNGVNNNVTSNDDEDQSDSLSDAGSDGSVSSLIAFDLQEDLSAESWWGPDGLGVPENSQSLSLRGLAAAVRKQDDADAVLDALARVEVLVRAEPDELSVVAPELARSLLHCKIPVWTTTEASSNNTKTSSSSSSSSKAHNPTPAAAIGLDPNAEVQRQRALTAVLSLSPLTVGDIVISELYSPHLDQYQRMLILDCLAAAAVEMSDYRKAPRVTAAAPGQVPKLLPSLAQQKQTAAAKTASLPSSSDMTQQLTPAANSAATSSDAKPPAAAAAPGMAAVSSRVWGKVSLHKQKEAAAAGVSSSAPRTFRNRFAPIAIHWASLLLKSCDVKHHGIDLFGRDSLLLGRLLTVFGTFVEAAAATPAAVPLVAGLLELLKANEVSKHKEVFVRRSALVAASQVVRHLPPARLAGAMVGRQQDLQDQVLVERLQWLMSWSQSVAATDADEQCRMLAGGCCAWHVELAEGAMACLEQMPENEGPSLVGTRGGSRRSQKEGVQVTLPSLTDRLVLQG